MREEIERLAAIMRAGGIILYPTDTVWGIGCDATNTDAVEKIYTLKGSHDKKGMIALIDSVDNVARYFTRTPAVAWDLLELSDKPLTLILPNAVGVAPNLIPQEGTLAVRVPQHDFCRSLAKKLGRPLVSTSANISGEATPKSFAEIDIRIKNGVDAVADARFEGKPTGKPSSIIAIGEGGEVTIIRE